MATEIIERLIDDITGYPAQRTVWFSLDGVVYEIDLSRASQRALEKRLAPFVRAARRRPGRDGKVRPAHYDATAARTARVREARAGGATIRAIATELNCSYGTVHRLLDPRRS